MNKSVKYVTLDCNVTSGSSGIFSFSTILTRDYDRCTGIAVIEKSLGGLTSLDVKIESSEGKTLVDFVDTNLLKLAANSLSIEPTKRFNDSLQFDMPSGNLATVVYLKTSAAATGLSYQIVFKLEKNDN